MARFEWKILGIPTSFLLAFFIGTCNVFAAPQSEEEAAAEAQAKAAEEAENDEASEGDLNRIFAGKDLPTSVHLKPMQEHFRKLVEKVRPATVGIQVGQSQGSGVIVSRDGYVLTAAHVISAPDLDARIILPDGTTLNAKTLGMDHSIDSGMLKITDEGKWPYLDVGVSESLNTGQWVMAIGHPGGYDETRAPPIRVGRLLSKDHERVLQTDCTLVGGDSGGPLVDMDGNVIGIHSRIGGRLDQNYHVPVDTYSINWDDLVAKKVVGRNRVRPSSPVYMGLSLNDSKMTIKSVEKDGPADKAGLKVDDEITRINGKLVTSQRSLRRELRKLKPDDKVKLVIKREGEEEIEVEITMGSPR